MNQHQQTVQVWDILVRIFHWSLVIAFAVAYLTSEEDNPIHIYAGYTVLGLISFRVIWGFLGSRYARFSDFVSSPSTVISYIQSILKRNPKHYTGHNPAGGWMVIAMLIVLFVVTLSGLKLYAIEDGKGPLAINMQLISPIASVHAEENDLVENNMEFSSEDSEHFWEETHEVSTNIMLLLIAGHIAGIVIAGKLHKESLIKAMLTGKKDLKK
jgi:cytochrome b